MERPTVAECLVHTIQINGKTSHLAGRYLLISCLIQVPLDMHYLFTCFLLMVREPLVGQVLLTVETSRSHSIHITLGKTPLHEWPAHSQRPLPDNTQHSRNRQTSIPPARFESAIPGSQRPQTRALDRMATEKSPLLIILVFSFQLVGVSNSCFPPVSP
jgi:hypothetical protein